MQVLDVPFAYTQPAIPSPPTHEHQHGRSHALAKGRGSRHACLDVSAATVIALQDTGVDAGMCDRGRRPTPCPP